MKSGFSRDSWGEQPYLDSVAQSGAGNDLTEGSHFYSNQNDRKPVDIADQYTALMH